MLHLSGKFILVILFIVFTSLSSQGRVHMVSDYGATGDKLTNDAPALQRAIEACAKDGGGMVYVPAGDYFCGQLLLKSNITLFLESGATLWVSPRQEHYPQENTFLYARDAENISIAGRGRIRGTGSDDLRRKKEDERPKPKFRVGILQLLRCRDVSIKDITIRSSDAWTLDLEFCENVVIDGVNILNNYYRVNADGIDPVSCKNVRISNCHIIAGDDCIVCKSRQNMPCQDVVITNCTLSSIATAVKIGTESHSDFCNIHVSNCVIRDSAVGIGIYIKDGATAERLSFSNLTIETMREPDLVREYVKNSIYPIFVDIEKRRAESRVGRIQDLNFTDIFIISNNGNLIQGMTNQNIENVVLRNITMRVDKPFDFGRRRKHVGGRAEDTDDRRRTTFAQKPSYMTLANIRGLTVDGLQVFVPEEIYEKYPYAALSLHNVQRGHISNISRLPAGPGMPVVILENCRDSLISNCMALPQTDVFLKITGEQTKNISLQGNDFSRARKAVEQ